jgi:DNA (cytosine-5)-methyltransferase 1
MLKLISRDIIPNMRSLELFSGAGGLAKGLERAGFEHAKFVEFDRNACESLRKNFEPSLVYEGDIRDFQFSDVSQIDLIAGGPPCQPFSLGGKHRASDDHRDMFPYAAKAVSFHKPKSFIFENVKGLLRNSFAPYFRYVILRLTYPEIEASTGETWEEHFARLRDVSFDNHSGVKYRVSYKLLNAADFGVPQVRERVFIVGIRSDVQNEWSFPKPTHSRKSLIEEQNLSHKYWEKHNIPAPKDSMSLDGFLSPCSLQLDLGTELNPWNTVRDALMGVPHPDSDHGIIDHVYKAGARTYPGHTGSFIDLPAKTLKAGGHGVPGGENMVRYEDGSVRYFTVFEGKLLQTFDRDFQVSGAWGEGMRQIGNAVPTLLAEAIGRSMMDVLTDRRFEARAA